MTLTQRQRLALEYLSQLGEADSWRIGMHVWTHTDQCPVATDQARVGGGICGNLKKLGFVTGPHELGLYRITETGRAALHR